MLIFDQFKKGDRPLQLLSICVLLGMAVLLGRLWYLQIVSNKRFETNLKNRAFKTIRVPAVRGKILDRNGQVLAENRSRVNVNLYLEELLDQFDFEYTNVVRKAYLANHPGLTPRKLKVAVVTDLKREAAYRVASNITYQVNAILGFPPSACLLNQKTFFSHYDRNPYVPFPISRDLDSKQIAIYSERLSGQSFFDLETQRVRYYPNGSVAAHLLGYVRRHDKPNEDDEDEVQYKYYLPDFAGETGVEGAFDAALRGVNGTRRVLVNNLNYRQREMEEAAEPGQNIFLTIDLDIQKATEYALEHTPNMPSPRGAAIVMDVRNGDILALASSPTYDPNIWVDGVTSAEFAKLNDEKQKHMFNRAVNGAYPPGSTFKIVTSIACLENGLNPNESFYNRGYFQLTPTSKRVGDEADEGYYDFEKAFYKSSNTYFIYYGLHKAGLKKLLQTGKLFHLGERTDFAIGRDAAGDFPEPDDVVDIRKMVNMCIGQEITASPLQMAALTSAIANAGAGGAKLFWPRIVSHIKSQDTGEEAQLFAQGRERDIIHLNTNHLELIRHAMLMDTEIPGASAYKNFHEADGVTPKLKKIRVAGKTGTAEISYPVKDKVTWFVCYGPYEDPKYAVVVVVESGNFGGTTCAPVACNIFQAIEKLETRPAANKLAAEANHRNL